MRGFLICILLLGASVGAQGGASQYVHHVDRLVATPTPAGPLTLLADDAAWRADVPAGAIVFVEAHAAPGSAFLLRCAPLGSPDTVVLPAATRQGCLLGHAGPWRVVVDPALGVATNITVTFRGAHVDIHGIPAPFGLTLLRDGPGCVVPGACLP